jgi:hypothetical protein
VALIFCFFLIKQKESKREFILLLFDHTKRKKKRINLINFYKKALKKAKEINEQLSIKQIKQ